MKIIMLVLILLLSPISKAEGTIGEAFQDVEGNEYYLFKSYDDEVWWTLAAEEIGFVPEANKTYTLFYNNNGTTKETYKCDIAEDHDCECFVYDDKFITIKGGNQQ